ncbi:MAG: N-acetylmuramoyl-L-alanine amidase, partial [Planctomycetota bacterium]
VGNYEHKKPSPKQFYALVRLTKTLMKKYRIPLSHVLPHRAVRRGPTDCPGKAFPWKAFIQALKQ